MTPSIRTFLLINLLLSVTLITSLAIIGNLFLEHKDLQKHLDVKLTQTAFTIQAFLSQDFTAQDFKLLQEKINEIPKLQNSYFINKQIKKAYNSNYEKVYFQIWNAQGQLVLHSSGAPTKFLANQQLGLADAWISGEPWRIFATYDELSKIKIIVAEQYDFRNVLEGRLTQDSILIMLVTYPFLGLLIWIVVGRGLDSLKRVAYEVSHRDPSYLDPVDLEHVPLEIKPLVDELNKLFISLRQAFEREKRFAADAAHELRTPLAALKAQTQVALNATTDEERKESLRKVLAGVDRSTHVVQQLLTISRMVPEAGLDQSAKLNLARQAKEVIVELAPEGLNKGTEVELIAPEEPIYIMGNPTAVSILIRNLVDNAIRYTPENSTVQVIVNQESEFVMLTVIDNGPGIPEHLRSRVFERFFRILGNKSPGSGLGLGIVQQIVELHKAAIELGAPDTGTGLKVTIKFPKA